MEAANQIAQNFLLEPSSIKPREYLMKIVPLEQLPNFYKKSEKMRKQKAQEKVDKADKTDKPPKMTPQTDKQRTFSAVTTLGNNFTAKVKEESDESEKLALLKQGIVNAVKQFVSIACEKAEVNDLIAENPDFKHLQFTDPAAMFKPDEDALNLAQILSSISNLQETVVNLVNKNNSPTEAFTARIEKVYPQIVFEKVVLL